MNAVAIIEALYRLDLADEAWFTGCAQAMRPLLDKSRLGTFAGVYKCPDPYSFKVSEILIHDIPPKLESAVVDLGRLTPRCPIFIADSFLRRPVAAGSECNGWTDVENVRDGSLLAAGGVDSLVLNAIEPTGVGMCFGSFRAERVRLTKDDRAVLEAVARHLGAARRLRLCVKDGRLSPESADAVLTPGGLVCHALGAAKEFQGRESLARALRQMDHARSKRGRNAPDAHTMWPALIAGRWTLVDHFERDGRRYVLAVETRPPTAVELLSKRELEVLKAAMRGLENKVIAYELGIAHSTVKVLLGRVAHKLGVRTRRELLDRVAHLDASALEPHG